MHFFLNMSKLGALIATLQGEVKQGKKIRCETDSFVSFLVNSFQSELQTGKNILSVPPSCMRTGDKDDYEQDHI
jgi:hypothetical protein